MSLTVLSVVAIAAKLLAVLPVANGQSTTATCGASFNWMTNSRGQNPCLIAAYAQGACTGGQFTVDPLAVNTHYTGPSAAQQNPCQCSTPVYSLVSACATCQNRTVETWSAWSTACNQTYNSVFPETIPSGTTIPDWAYLDVVTSDNFSPTLAQADHGPESSASAKPTGTVSNTATSTATSAGAGTGPATSGGSGATSTPAAKKSSNAGPIAGGVIGGLVLLGVIGGLIAWLVMRKRRSQSAPSSAYGYGGGPPSEAPLNSPPPMSQHQSYVPPQNGTNSPRLYDPSDPTTFPHSPATPTIHTTQSTASPGPYGQQQYNHPGQYSGVPEV